MRRGENGHSQCWDYRKLHPKSVVSRGWTEQIASFNSVFSRRATNLLSSFVMTWMVLFQSRLIQLLFYEGQIWLDVKHQGA